MAAASMKRAGYVRLIAARAIVTTPSSMGWRSTSSTFLRNSGSSSRNNTPPWARLTSPGRGYEPPPMRPASEMVWCGARNGRRATSDSPTGTTPAMGGFSGGCAGPSDPRRGAARGAGDRPAPGRDRPLEPQLAQPRHPAEPLRRDLLRGGQDAHRDREVECGAVFADVGRGEVH